MANHSSVFAGPLALAFREALSYLERLDSEPVSATASLGELRDQLAKPLSDFGMDAEAVIGELVRDVSGGLSGSASGRFFAWAIGGSMAAALAADWLTSAWDQNAALYSCSPSAAVVEEVAGEWLKDLLGLPASASFAFVSGCQMAHVCCLAAARHALLSGSHAATRCRRANLNFTQGGCPPASCGTLQLTCRPRDAGGQTFSSHSEDADGHPAALSGNMDVERSGLYGATRIRILTSNRHGSVARAVRLLGLGDASIVDLKLDGDEQVTAATLAAALDDVPDVPTIVLLQAGDLNTGSFDNYRELIPLAKDRGAWVHVDGAFGLWAAASSKYRHLLEGVAAADSWATDGHKWLNVPYDSGFAFIAHPQDHRAAMSHRASYLVHDQDARDQIDWNPEWSRRGRGFAAYAAIRQLGRAGLEAMINRCCEHACAIVDGVGRLAGTEVLWRPRLNQGLVRFLDPAQDNVPQRGAGEQACSTHRKERSQGEGNAEHDRFTDTVIQALFEDGEGFFMGTTWRGVRAMRVSVLNWQTSARDVERAIAAVSRCLLRVRESW